MYTGSVLLITGVLYATPHTTPHICCLLSHTSIIVPYPIHVLSKLHVRYSTYLFKHHCSYYLVMSPPVQPEAPPHFTLEFTHVQHCGVVVVCVYVVCVCVCVVCVCGVCASFRFILRRSIDILECKIIVDYCLLDVGFCSCNCYC